MSLEWQHSDLPQGTRHISRQSYGTGVAEPVEAFLAEDRSGSYQGHILFQRSKDNRQVFVTDLFLAGNTNIRQTVTALMTHFLAKINPDGFLQVTIPAPPTDLGTVFQPLGFRRDGDQMVLRPKTATQILDDSIRTHQTILQDIDAIKKLLEEI